MFKTLSAAALSATLAFTCLTPSTAHAADQDDIGRFILGASLLAMIAAAANARSEDDDDDRYVTRSPEREVHHHRHGHQGDPHADATATAAACSRSDPQAIQRGRDSSPGDGPQGDPVAMWPQLPAFDRQSGLFHPVLP